MLANHMRTILLGLTAIVFTSACSHVNVPVQRKRLEHGRPARKHGHFLQLQHVVGAENAQRA